MFESNYRGAAFVLKAKNATSTLTSGFRIQTICSSDVQIISGDSLWCGSERIIRNVKELVSSVSVYNYATSSQKITFVIKEIGYSGETINTIFPG